MIIGINAGHTASGIGSGAVGFINESKETRQVCKYLIAELKKKGHKVVDCTINKAVSQGDYLQKAVKFANNEKLDYFISVHFNAGGGKGTEVYTYKGKQFSDAVQTAKNIESIGFKNRGVKDGSKLYVINKTKAKAMLIEVCFVDSSTDVGKYKAVGAKKVAQMIAKAL